MSNSLSSAVAELEAERDRLAQRVWLLERDLTELRSQKQARERDLTRLAYRRGYHTGRKSMERGAPMVTNPESTARGWIREMCK